MIFSKTKWLETANSQIERGILSQREVDDALKIWVNAFDGKSEDELKALGEEVDAEWLI